MFCSFPVSAAYAVKEDSSVAMEELCLLLRLAAHVIADPGEGETPMIPLSLTHASSACTSAGQVDLYSCTRAYAANAVVVLLLL